MSATFAASLVTSPAIGAYLGAVYGDEFVIVLASIVALIDVLFIAASVPESLPLPPAAPAGGLQPSEGGASSPTVGHQARISWEKADPFAVSISVNIVFTL